MIKKLYMLSDKHFAWLLQGMSFACMFVGVYQVMLGAGIGITLILMALALILIDVAYQRLLRARKEWRNEQEHFVQKHLAIREQIQADAANIARDVTEQMKAGQDSGEIIRKYEI